MEQIREAISRIDALAVCVGHEDFLDGHQILKLVAGLEIISTDLRIAVEYAEERESRCKTKKHQHPESIRMSLLKRMLGGKRQTTARSPK